MALGECIFQDFVLMATEPPVQTVLETEVSRFQDCCYELKALATTSGSEAFKNDFHSVTFFYDQTFTGATMILQRYEGSWIDVATLNNNDFGTFFDFGFYTNEVGERLMQYRIDWQLVLNHPSGGEGTYRIKTEDSDVLGGTTNQFSFDFCLQEYTPQRANKTVRIEWVLEGGKIGDINNDQRANRYGSTVVDNQIRLTDAYFGLNPEYEIIEESVRYQNGLDQWLQDAHERSYPIDFGRVPSLLNEYIIANVLKGDIIKITDYNNNNPHKYIEKRVKKLLEYNAEFSNGAKRGRVTAKVKEAFLNNKHERC